MQFAGLEKLTLIDYPGRLSAVAFTYGCNMRCPYCHNPELVIEPLDSDRIWKERDILKFLEGRVGKLDALSITGGEPTMHSGLTKFMQKVKDMGFDIKLDTNGTLPDRVKEILDSNLVDYWAMDVKHGKEVYEQKLGGNICIEDIQESIQLIKQHAKDYEFRCTVSRSLHNNMAIRDIGEMVQGSKRFYLQNFNAGKTIDPNLNSSESFNEKELLRFQEVLREYVKDVYIRGV